MLDKNLTTLQDRYPELVEELQTNNKLEETNLNIIEAKNGSKTAYIKSDTRSILVHSKYNPEKEAERIINQAKLRGLNAVIVLGFGLGYHIIKLFEKIKDEQMKILVIENNPYLFKEALRYHDFTSMFSSADFHLFVKEKIEKRDVFKFINKGKIDGVFNKIKTIKLNSVVKYDKDYKEIILPEINDFFNRSKANEFTTKKFGKTWNDNLLKNINLIVNNIGINKLKGLNEGRPAIIVSAGPSLNKNIDNLKLAQGKSLIITSSTALKPLLDKDIIPDIVTVADGSDKMLEHFKGLENKDRLKDVILVTAELINTKILHNWPGSLVFAPVAKEDHIMRWLEQYIEYKGRITSGGSVAHFAFVIAYYLGAEPIVFIGQDLCFNSEYTHVKNAPGKGKLEEHRKERPNTFLKVKDINNNLVWTRNDFILYLKWFNKNIKTIREEFNDDRDIIDATEGGLRIEGTKLMTLKETIKEYFTIEIDKENLLDKVSSFVPNWDENLIIELNNVLKKIKEIKKISKTGLKLIDQLIDNLSYDANKVTEISLRLEEINEQINELKDGIIFFESEIYDIYFKESIDIYNNIQILNQFVDFYNKLIIGSKKAIKILEEECQKLIARRNN